MKDMHAQLVLSAATTSSPGQRKQLFTGLLPLLPCQSTLHSEGQKDLSKTPLALTLCPKTFNGYPLPLKYRVHFEECISKQFL
jgi:hypothetical protein